MKAIASISASGFYSHANRKIMLVAQDSKRLQQGTATADQYTQHTRSVTLEPFPTLEAAHGCAVKLLERVPFCDCLVFTNWTIGAVHR